ncbi:MAG: FAD-binding oxidoreductase [Planctomycetes bacterium]|nr:FAD-binding oxidoreductase [Planctomycetota bacterium]
MSTARILIVGGGIAGVATARELACRGARDVLLLERDAALGTRATGRNAAILRSVMAEPAVRRASVAGSRFLRAPPPGFSPVPLVDPCGLLMVAGTTGRAELERWRAALAGELELRDLAPSAIRALAPHWRGAAEIGLFAPDEGRLHVPAILAAFERHARSGGVRFALGARVSRLRVEGARVTGVELADGSTLAAERVVLAAGAWSSALARAAGSPIELVAKRRHLAVTLPSARVDPRWPVVWSLDDEFYVRVDGHGLVACVCDQAIVPPDTDEIDPAVVARIAARLAELVPGGGGSVELARAWCGLRTFAADGDFVLGPDPMLAGLVWVGGLGGHGITASVAVARLAADWILDEHCDDELAVAFLPERLVRASGGAR